ncbi:MAG: ISKra4 family transposase, partial [Verrucomicrobiaceae bacterium]|nr:ISKra4 family transposase [Verrucomicrobiaceae bacterium]
MVRGRNQQESWLEEACHRLKYDRGSAVALLGNFKQTRLEITKGPRAKALDKAISYFGNHEQRMNYSVHVAMGLPIGSRVTEAGCKTVVKQRMCGSGMKWQLPGAKQILALRTMVLTNDRWEQFWQKVSQFGFT